MSRAALITRVIKPVLYLLAVLPLAWLLFALVTGLVMGDQVKFMQHVTGDTVLTCLMLTLAVTPLRRITGWNEIIRVRRLIGLTAFWYACLHLTTYLVFDQMLDVGEIAKSEKTFSGADGKTKSGAGQFVAWADLGRWQWNYRSECFRPGGTSRGNRSNAGRRRR